MQTKNPPQNYIAYDPKGNASAFFGPEAVDLFRCAALAAAMMLYDKGLRYSRMSGRQALDEAQKYTGNKYKRCEYMKAREELSAMVRERKAVMPAVQNAA